MLLRVVSCGVVYVPLERQAASSAFFWPSFGIFNNITGLSSMSHNHVLTTSLFKHIWRFNDSTQFIIIHHRTLFYLPSPSIFSIFFLKFYKKELDANRKFLIKKSVSRVRVGVMMVRLVFIWSLRVISSIFLYCWFLVLFGVVH